MNRDKGIAKYLDLLYEDYIDILLSNKSYIDEQEHYFRTKKDANKVIEILEPYLVLATLTQ